MLLSTSHKFVYVHVPRTAGSSIEQVLRPWARASVNNITGKLVHRLRQPSLWQHCHFRHHERMRSINIRLPASLRESLFSFAFVRNPFDWLVSLYEYQRQLVVLQPNNNGFSWFVSVQGKARAAVNGHSPLPGPERSHGR